MENVSSVGKPVFLDEPEPGKPQGVTLDPEWKVIQEVGIVKSTTEISIQVKPSITL